VLTIGFGNAGMAPRHADRGVLGACPNSSGMRLYHN
jgi:hypothetical protein